MKPIENLIATLERCIPELDTTPLLASLPENSQTHTVLAWMYHHLSEQGLMAYEEWSEYTGSVPALKPLANVSVAENPEAFIYARLEEIDWSTASVDPAELPYVLPWLEHINFYLKPSGLRLVDLLPFENAYMFCVRDDEAMLDKLNSDLEVFGMGINERAGMDQQQIADEIASMT